MEQHHDLVQKFERLETGFLEELRSWQEERQTLEKRIHQLEQENERIRQPVSERPAKPVTSPEMLTQFTAFGCLSDELVLSCPEGRTIFTTSAVYGRYDVACTPFFNCCPPDPLEDCTELVEENRPEDWLAIKLLCDNRTICTYEYGGSTIDECGINYVADYLHIFYDCLPYDANAPVGFTASSNTGANTTYQSGQIVIYNDVISNIGGHYNPDTSSFICPYDGVYMFDINVISYYYHSAHIAVYRNVTLLSQTQAYSYGDIHQLYPTSSTHVITPCAAGEVVWVRATAATNLHAVSRFNLFSGYLLYNYEQTGGLMVDAVTEDDVLL